MPIHSDIRSTEYSPHPRWHTILKHCDLRRSQQVTDNAGLYHYAGNNPIRYMDPDGRTTGYLFIKIEGFYDSSNNIHIDSFSIIYGNNSKAVQREFNKILTSGDRLQISPLENSDSIIQKNGGFTKIIITTRVSAYESEDKPSKFNPTEDVQSTEKFEFQNISLREALDSITIFLNNDDTKPNGAVYE